MVRRPLVPWPGHGLGRGFRGGLGRLLPGSCRNRGPLRRSRRLLREERCPTGAPLQLGVPEQADGAVDAIVAGVAKHLSPAQPRQRLGHQRRRHRSDVLQREGVEERELRSETRQQAFVVQRHPFALGAHPVNLPEDLRQRDQPPGVAGGVRPRPVRCPVRQVLDPVHDPHGQGLAACRAAAVALAGLVRLQADIAVAVAVQMVLALFGKELQGPAVTLARLQCPAQGEIIHRGVEDAYLPAQLLRRVGVGIGHQPETVQGRHPPVHRRVRRKARLHREDVRRQVPIAVVHGVEAGLGAQRGEPRGPHMGRHQVRSGSRLQRHLQQVPGVQPQDRPPVGVQVADLGKAGNQPVRRVEVRGVDQVMDLPGLVALLVDGRDLHRQHEPDRIEAAGAGRWKLPLHGPFEVGAQTEEPGFRGNELLLQLGAPGRMGEVARADDADALLARPDGQVLQVAVPAGGAGESRVDVQVRVEGHGARCFSAGVAGGYGASGNWRRCHARLSGVASGRPRAMAMSRVSTRETGRVTKIRKPVSDISSVWNSDTSAISPST